jgi:hypothetical protein
MAEKKRIGVGIYLTAFVILGLTLSLVMPSLVKVMADKENTTANLPTAERLAEEIMMATDSIPTGIVTTIEYMDGGLSRVRVELDDPLIGEVDATFCSPYLTSISGSLGPVNVGDMVRLKKYRYNQPRSENSSTNFFSGNNGEWIVCQQLFRAPE